MTEVLCTFDECLYYKSHDECYGVCTKERIILDEEVSGRTCGCPDAEWDEPQRNMAEDIAESFGFKAESYRQAKAKTEPQTEVIACPIIDDDAWIYKDEWQTEGRE